MMEVGKRYTLKDTLVRTLFGQDQHLRPDQRNVAGGERVVLESGTEVEVVDIDGTA